MDEDLVSHLEKKIKKLEEELSKKSEVFEECTESSIKLVHENIELQELLAQSKDENTRLKAKLDAAPKWVPVGEFKSDSQEHIVWNSDDQDAFVALMYEGRLLDVTHVLVNLGPPAASTIEQLDDMTRECMRAELEDPRGDGDFEPERMQHEYSEHDRSH